MSDLWGLHTAAEDDWEDPAQGGPQTLYRGIVVPSPVDLEGLAKSVGRNWTTDDEVSGKFSDPTEYRSIPSTDSHRMRGGEGPFVGVHFEGEWDGNPESVDHDWHRVHPDENEIRVKPGTPIKIKNVNYVYPEAGWDDENILADGPRDFHASTDGIRYAHVVEADVAEDLMRLAMPQPMPKDITFHYHPTNATIGTEPYIPDPTVEVPKFMAPAVEARHHGQTVGYLEWEPPLHATNVNGIQYGDHPPEVSMIKVHPDYRRHGIATALFDFARQHQGDLEHSDWRSELGNKWVDYEQGRKTAMPAPLPQGIHFAPFERGDETSRLIQNTYPDITWEPGPGIAAHLPGHSAPVGHIEWLSDQDADEAEQYGEPKINPGEVAYINVDDGLRRHSIGTELFDQARAHEPRVHHSPDRTELGEKWIGYEQSRQNVMARLASSEWPDPSQETIPADPAYVYHGTHHYNAYDIADGGQLDVHDPDYGTDQDTWPDGSVEPRSYWTHDPQVARNFYPENGRPTLLRSLRSSGNFRQEKASGDLYSTSPVSADHLEVYSGPGQWTPLTQHREQRNARIAMPAPLPKGVFFRYHPELMWSPGVTAHLPGGKQVGSLEWYDDDHVMVDLGTRRPGEIDRISVHPDHQGNSIATSMFDFAKQYEPRLHHSDQLTDDGRGWSEYEKARHARLAAAVAEDLTNRLDKEFHQWWDENGEEPENYFGESEGDEDEGNYWEDPNSFAVRGPLGHWPNIENFLKDKYPAAHKGLDYGDEEASRGLDGGWVGDEYETGPEAVAKHGYDPKEIAAGMLLLHNSSHPGRADWHAVDQQRLHDIAQKRFKMQRNYDQRNARLAAVNQDFVDRLGNEFWDWHEQRDKNSETYMDWRKWGDPDAGPIGHWPSIEEFLKDKYPAAHRGLEMGYEEAGPVLDSPSTAEMWKIKPYETGSEAEARHGYDPREVAAAMLLMHNGSHPLRADTSDEDQQRLVDIAQKRYKMQRNYEQRNARLAMAWQDWAPHVQNDFYKHVSPDGLGKLSHYCEPGGCSASRNSVSAYWVDHGQGKHSHLTFTHYPEEKSIDVNLLGTHEDFQGDGVAEALIRRLHQDHPGMTINPGSMTGQGRAFHDRMLEKEPEARSVVTAGLNGELPENLTFQHHPAGPGGFPDVITPSVSVSHAFPTVSAHDGDKMVGYLQWYDDHPRRKGEIWDLRVHPDYQRRGIGTALFDWTTDKIEPDLHHSNNLSDEGRAFAEAEVARPLADERYEAWRNGQPMPKRFAGRNGPPPPMTFEPFNTYWSNGIMARHAEDGRPLAHLHWYPDGEIESIRVHPEMQGRDIGKHILAHAVMNPDTYEAPHWGIQPSNHMTEAGRAYARSLGYNPPDDEVTPANNDVNQWGWTAVKDYVPLHIPYTGQNEDEMSKHLDQPWTPPQQRTASADDEGWPVWWRGRHRPAGPFDKRWHPNHPEHIPAPWDN